VYSESFWGDLKETDYLENIGMDGWRIFKTNLQEII
jgi:hypothetical protein